MLHQQKWIIRKIFTAPANSIRDLSIPAVGGHESQPLSLGDNIHSSSPIIMNHGSVQNGSLEDKFRNFWRGVIFHFQDCWKNPRCYPLFFSQVPGHRALVEKDVHLFCWSDNKWDLWIVCWIEVINSRSWSQVDLPSRELTYPPKMAFWRWFSFSQGGIC